MAWKPPSNEEIFVPPQDEEIGTTPPSMLDRLAQTARNLIKAPLTSIREKFSPPLTPYGLTAAKTATQIAKTGPIGIEGQRFATNPENELAKLPSYLSTAGTTFGLAGAGIGGATGEALRQGGQAILGSTQVPQSPTESLSRIAAEGAKGAALYGATKTLNLAGEKAVKAGFGAARRALGFNKSLLTNAKSAFEALRKQALANKATQAAINENVIAKLGSTETTLQNVRKMFSKYNSTLNTAIDAAEKAGARANFNNLGDTLIDELKPKYTNQQKLVENLFDDITKNLGSKTPLKAFHELKTRWGKLGFDQKMTGTEEANMYRKAAILVEQKITNAIEQTLGKEAALSYVDARGSVSAALNAMKGLTQKVGGEMGNSALSLTSYPFAAARIVSGDLTGAATAMGLTEGMRRRGAGIAFHGLTATGKLLQKPNPAIVQAGFNEIMRRYRERQQK